MSSNNFFKSAGFLIGAGVVIGAAGLWLALELTDKDSYVPNPTTENCIYIRMNQMDEWFEKGWNQPDDENYIRSLMFVSHPADAEGKISRVEIIPVKKNRDGTCEIKERLTTDMNIHSKVDCRYPIAITENDTTSYDFVPDDAIGEEIVRFRYLRIVPFAVEGKLEYRVDMIITESGQEIQYRRIGVQNAKPCPPYCHHPSAE